MEGDLRYYDLTSRLQECGVDWKHLALFLEATTLHPFTSDLQSQVKFCQDESMKDLMDEELIIYQYGFNGTNKQESHFHVHVGAVEQFCDYLGLPKITRHEATQENLEKMSKPYKIPALDRDPKTFLEVREKCKKLWDRANSQKNKREANRMRMIASVLDHDQELRKIFA